MAGVLSLLLFSTAKAVGLNQTQESDARKLKEYHARLIAAKAMSEIEKGNVDESVIALLSVVPTERDMPYVPEVEQALRSAFEKYSITNWIYTELDGYYQFIYLTPDEKYLVCENNENIDILSTENNELVASIPRINIVDDNSKDWGSLPSKEGSKLYVVDDKDIRLFDIEKNSSVPVKGKLSDCFPDIWFTSEPYRFKNNLNFKEDNIESLSHGFKYYIVRREFEPSSKDEDPYYKYEIKDSDGKVLFTFDEDYQHFKFDIVNMNLINAFSFSPDDEKLVLSFQDGHNELRSMNNLDSSEIWSCGNDDCWHYSNSNFFVNDDTIFHKSAFEEKIKLFDVNTLEATDSINFLFPLEGASACMNREGDKLWVTEYDVPVFYQKVKAKEIDDFGLKSLGYRNMDEIRLNDRIIRNNKGKIECVDTDGKELWTYESNFGSSLLGTFDNDRLIMIDVSWPRGGDMAVFLDKESGKEIYECGDFSLQKNEGDNRLFVSNYGAYGKSSHEILGYEELIENCKQIVKGKTMSRKGVKKFFAGCPKI